jgi:uncharacterized membrane protein YbhN (UPF0104 family)
LWTCRKVRGPLGAGDSVRRPHRAPALLRRPSAKALGSVAQAFGSVAQALRDARSVPLRTWFAVALSGVINWLLDMSCLVLAAAAVHAGIGWSRLALIYLAVQVVRQIPLTPGGIGLVETGMLAGLVAAGVPQATAVAVVLIYRLISFWLILPTGLAAHLTLRRATGRPRPASRVAARHQPSSPAARASV